MILALLGLAACGGHGTATPSPDKRDAGASPAAALEVAARPLGLADVAAYGWRTRAGQDAFREARKAEDREDWPTVVTACTKALAADPGHLEAAWLLAAALGSLGKHAELLAPLQLAESGDFGKWGPASLELPALHDFLATAAGEAWRRRVEADRAAYIAALARSVVVASDGDLYAYDATGPRYYRLTRTGGGVIGALAVPSAHELIYVTRTRQKRETHVGVGVVDLAHGHTRRPVDVPAAPGPGSSGAPSVGALAIAALPDGGVWIESLRGSASWRLDDNNKLEAIPAKSGRSRPPGPWLEVLGRTPRLHRVATGVTADFDEHSLASQMRLDSSKRVVSVPSPGQIDGSSVVWSPDGSRLALVAQLDEHCTSRAAAAVFVVDASTGTLRELERGSGGLAVEWLADRKLAVAGPAGVAIYDLDGGKPMPLPGTTDVVTPRRVPRCTPTDADDAGSGSGSGSGVDLDPAE